MRSFAHTASSLVFAISCFGTGLLLTGCGMGTVSNDVSPIKVNTLVSGNVHGGTQGVSGATVQLWQTGTSGYGSGATLLATTYSSAGNGFFSFPTPVTIASDCSTSTPTGPYTYVTAAGGDPTSAFGASATTIPTRDNQAILLAAMIGCGAVNASTTVYINEVTTAAAAYALGNFSTVSTVAEANSDTLPQLNIGAPTTNNQGLADAVANAALLANVSTGLATASTSTVEVPTAALNTLANIVASCTNVTSAATAPCPSIFGYATAPGGTAPGNIYSALMNIAKYPGNNVTNLLSAATAYAPYQPTLAGGSAGSVLNDLSFGIAYTNSTLGTATVTPAILVLDGLDNVWVIGAATAATTAGQNYIGELPSPNASSGGTPTYSSGLTTAAALNGLQNIRDGAFDTNNNLWMSDGASATLIEIPFGSSINSATATTFSSPTSGTTSYLDQNLWAVAIDGSNDVWTSSYGAQGKCTATNGTSSKVCEYLELKTGTTQVNTFGTGATQTGDFSVRGMAADSNTGLTTYNGYIWAADYGQLSPSTTAGNQVTILQTTGTNAGTSNVVTVGPSGAGVLGVALDGSSNGWITAATIAGLYKVPPTSTSTSTISAVSVTAPPAGIMNTTNAPANTATASVTVGGLNTPTYLAVDGVGNIWVANAGYSTVAEYAPAYTTGGATGAFLSPYYGFSPSVATTATPANQALFTCSGTTMVTCSIAGGAFTGSNKSVAVDLAGSVWTLGSNGTLLEIIGTAAPTNPVQAAGKYGVKP